MLKIPMTSMLLLALLMTCCSSSDGAVDAGEDAAGDSGTDAADGLDGQADDFGDMGDTPEDGTAQDADGGEDEDGDNPGDDAPAMLSLTSVDPSQGGASVTTSVSLLGTGFGSGLEVYVGGVPAADVTVVSSEEATAVFGPVEPIDCGIKDIRLVLGGSESTLLQGFEYWFDEDPIVFVHGYLMTSLEWNSMIEGFRDRGYPDERLFAINYQNSLDSNIVHARDELSVFVEDVLQQTGASRVDLVGHSNGGMSSRLWVVVFGGHEKVRDFVSVAGTHHGNELACLASWSGESAEEQCPAYASEADSHNGVQWMLNGDPDTPDIDETPFGREDGGFVAYSALWTEDDLINVPAHTSCLNQMQRGDCSDPVNIMYSGVGHIEMVSNPAVIETVFDLVRVYNISKP
ncbi:MAG: alpha/beta fold hydrolase [Deltaproteobacteria bacterium]|nr:alpha/beta fold hydrolase [Deltaproteobacteria bacterium]MBW1873036.1 alpha/beta fold hydrolase [Deltaproteobacteria bacterium]